MHYFIQKLKALENNGYTKCDNEHDMFKGMCLFKILANIFDDYSFIISYCELIRDYSNISNEFDSYLLNGEPMKFDKISRTVIQILDLIYDLIDIDEKNTMSFQTMSRKCKGFFKILHIKPFLSLRNYIQIINSGIKKPL